METDALTLNEQKEVPPRKITDNEERTTVHFLSVSNSSIIQSKCSVTETNPESEATGRQTSPISRKPQNYLTLALITLLFNFPFGCAAIILSLLSSKSFFKGNQKESARRGRLAKWVSIIGLAVAVVVVLFIIVYDFVIVPNVIDNIRDLKLP